MKVFFRVQSIGLSVFLSMYDKPMGKKKHNLGKHVSLKRPDGWGRWLSRFKYNINPFVKGFHAVIAILVDIALLFMIYLLAYEGYVCSLVWRVGGRPTYTAVIFIVLGSVFVCLCFVFMCGVIWDKEDHFAMVFPFLPHIAYIFLILPGFSDYLLQLDPTKKDLRDAEPPYMCLIVFLLVEVTALLFYAHDVVCNLEGDQPSRWWVRTTPYACIGIILSIVLRRMEDPLRYSTFYSVAVSVLAVNYLMQIINDRIVPKEGPYKELHHKADADRSEGGEAAAC